MKKQQGQVLPLGLALLVFGMLGGYVLFNTGQVATDKMKLVNTADAAAYSGTLWQARALNFQSYANRAMVANQVSIAQAVTLQSWVAYAEIGSENIATVLKPVPVFNLVSEGLQRGLQVVENVVTPVASALVSVVDVVNQGLSMAQEALFVSTFVATPDVVRSVVEETDKRFTINTGFSGLGLAKNLGQWHSFTEKYAADDVAAMDERMQMINDSRDQFSRQRNWKFFDFWFYSTPLTRHQIRREGTTKLIRVKTEDGFDWEWKAKDTQSLHTRLWHWKGTKRYEVPIGWAEAFANSANASRTIEPGVCTSVRDLIFSHCPRFLNMNRSAEFLADLGVRSVQGSESRIDMRNYTGVQAYRSLSQARISEDQPTISLKVEVALPTAAVKGSDALGSRGQFEAPVQAPGEKLTSVSVAEVFYKRPDSDLPGRHDMPLEPANGYNPYWGSRLSPVSAGDRLVAFALRGDIGSTSAPDGADGGPFDSTTTLNDYIDSGLSDGQSGGQSGDGGWTDLDTDALLPDGQGNVMDFDAVAALQPSDELDQFRQDIEDKLMDALRDQVGNMLSAAVSGSYGGGARSLEELEDELGQMATQAVGDLADADAIKPYTDAVNEANTMAREYEEEFRATRQRIVDDFQQSFETLNTDFNEEVSRLEGEIQAQQDILADELSTEAQRRQAQETIDNLDQDLQTLQEGFRGDLAVELQGIVNDASDVYDMSLADATYLVDEFLRSEQESIELPWAEVVEEDDTDD